MFRCLTTLALAILLIAPGLALAQESGGARHPLPSQVSQRPIIFKGKVYCSLTREVEIFHYGIITEILVSAGQAVKNGKELARFKLTQPDINRMQSMLSRVPVSRIRVNLQQAKKELKDNKTRVADAKRMLQQKLAPKITLEQAEADRDLSQSRVKLLELELREAQTTLRNNQGEVAEWTGNAAPLGKLPEICAMKAPIDGHIIWVNPDLRPNAQVAPTKISRKSAFLVGVMSPMLVRAKVHEMEAMRLKVGDKAQVEVDSLPGRKFPATVSRLAWSPDALDPVEASYYQIELIMPNDKFILKNGLKCRITITK